jgi:hypothetical protein
MGGSYQSSTDIIGNGEFGENWVKLHINADTGNGDYIYLWKIYEIEFVWANGPSSDGLCNTTSWIQPNGLYQTVLDHGCLNNPWSHVYMDAWFALGQHNPNGDFAYTEEHPPTRIFNRKQQEINGAAVYTYPVLEASDEVEMTIGPFPVVSDYPVVATMILLMCVTGGDGGEGDIDFMTDNLRVNVPSVWHVVDYP